MLPKFKVSKSQSHHQLSVKAIFLFCFLSLLLALYISVTKYIQHKQCQCGCYQCANVLFWWEYLGVLCICAVCKSGEAGACIRTGTNFGLLQLCIFRSHYYLGDYWVWFIVGVPSICDTGICSFLFLFRENICVLQYFDENNIC